MTLQNFIDEAGLRAIAAEAAVQPRCNDCAPLWQPGWESVSGAMNVAHLAEVATLGAPDSGEQLDEFHPQGTQLWSADAPIALGWHPYNRCSVWRCARCAAAFLRYTEYGGYYVEERIRPLHAHLLVAPESSA